MTSKSGSTAISKNFSFKPTGGISSMIWTGPGGQSQAMYEPAPNPSLSKNLIEQNRKLHA